MANIPESEDLLSLKRGSETVMPCHVCFAERHSLPLFTRTMRQTLKHTKSLLAGENGSGGQQDLETRVNLLSTHPISSVLSSFPFIGIHPLADLFATF